MHFVITAQNNKNCTHKQFELDAKKYINLAHRVLQITKMKVKQLQS